RTVDRYTYRTIAAVDDTSYIVEYERVVTANVQLKGSKHIGSSRCDGLQTGRAQGAQELPDSEQGGGAGDGGSASRIECVQAADRCECDRQAKVLPKARYRHVDMPDITEDSRPERNGIERLAIAPNSCLAFRASDDRVPLVPPQNLMSFADDLVQ